jgi:hypothetical protein
MGVRNQHIRVDFGGSAAAESPNPERGYRSACRVQSAICISCSKYEGDR